MWLSGCRPAHVDSHVRTWQAAGASETLEAAARMTLASRLSIHCPAAVVRATCYGTDAPRHGTRAPSTTPIIPSTFKLHPSNTIPQLIHTRDLNWNSNVAKVTHCLKKDKIHLWQKFQP